MSGDGERSWITGTWPLDRGDWLRLGVSLLIVIGAFSAVGWAYTDALAPNALTELDERVADDLVEGRTDTRTDIAHWGSTLADTLVKIGVTALAAVIMIAVWRRWHEPLFLAVSLIFEATAFIAITTLVARARPDVERLLDSPVNSSFPSGHVAAATVYGAFVVITFWHTRRTWIRALAVVAAALVVVIVAWSRMYQGMHRNKGRVGILIDQRVHPREGKPYAFFGHPAITTLLPAQLSLRTGAPVVPVFALPTDGWRRFKIVITDPIYPPDRADRSAADSLTIRYLEVMERAIRKYPELWLWMHRRWRVNPTRKKAHRESIPDDNTEETSTEIEPSTGSTRPTVAS